MTEIKINTKFYEFSQNNSGGSFVDGYKVFIEAIDENQANQKAQEHFDIYFNGCDVGRDCFCCGDRWSEASDYNAFKFPEGIEQTYENLIEIVVAENFSFSSEYVFDENGDMFIDYSRFIKEYNENNNKNYTPEEFVRNIKMFWGINCYVLTYDNQKIKFDGFGIVYE